MNYCEGQAGPGGGPWGPLGKNIHSRFFPQKNVLIKLINRETTLFRGFSKIAKEHYLPHTDRERTGWTVARLLDFFGKLYTV